MAVPIFINKNISEYQDTNACESFRCITRVVKFMQADACTKEKGIYEDNASYIQTIIV